jgi:hypothetical protein
MRVEAEGSCKSKHTTAEKYKRICLLIEALYPCAMQICCLGSTRGLLGKPDAIQRVPNLCAGVEAHLPRQQVSMDCAS